VALPPYRYLELIQSDTARIVAASPAALASSVPCCPGWDVAEVVRHTGGVYNHKVAIMRLGRAPEQGEWESRPPGEAGLVPWFDGAAHALLDELVAHDPADWAYTWWPADQTIGFWYRRMALESVVHRIDVEEAVADVTPIDAALALDGVDEVLTVFLGVRDRGAAGGPTGAVSIVSDGQAWIAHLDEDHVHVEKGSANDAGAQVVGDPSAVFLHLWGRAPAEDVGVSGDATLVHQLRRRLAAATQ
jgi:uncharacterized protein (TIGR03083 family)